MELDRIIHDKKNFVELDDIDIETFLRERRFGSEHLSLEFKSEFRSRKDRKYDIREICKYIVGLSNEEGGLVVYGVADSVKDLTVAFPVYVTGLDRYPSLEDLSQWVKDRIHPLIVSPSIRFFVASGRKVAVLKVPAGANKPYCYLDPQTKALTYFKKTAGGIAELAPDQVNSFYRAQIIEQADAILRASKAQGVVRADKTSTLMDRVKKHWDTMRGKLENLKDYGFLGIYCEPRTPLQISVEDLKQFLELNRSRFSEVMRYFPGVEVFQSGVSVGYFPRAIRKDIKSTARISLYRDGLIAFDSQADHLMDKDRNLNPLWLSYEIQRHLQLAKALLGDSEVQTIRVLFVLENIEAFSMRFYSRFPFSDPVSKYSGTHEPISKEVELSEIHDFDGKKRNIAMDVVKEMIDEVSRIFGFSKALPGLWDDSGKLKYVKGLENVR